MPSRTSSWIWLVALSAALTQPAPTSHAESIPPNIVLILADDMRYDELRHMPYVKQQLIARGVTFTNSFVSNPLCCPSRATIQTGMYSRSTRVYSNQPARGGWETFHGRSEDASTIATWLHTGSVNYRTALVGKYMNGYKAGNSSFVPPGWNRWAAWAPEARDDPGYYDFPMSIDGHRRDYGSANSDYSTDVYARLAANFIDDVPAGRPLFLYFAPRAPHGPITAPARHSTDCPGVANPRYPSFLEQNVSDKPLYIRTNPEILEGTELDRRSRQRCQMLLAVDDAVRTIVDELRATGRFSSTFIMFASDNGVEAGEHRWNGKKVPYEESIRVPTVVRYDPLTNAKASTDPHLLVNVDWAPTFADLASVAAPGAEGSSFLPLIQHRSIAWRSDFLIEHADDPDSVEVPTYCGVRSARYTYVKHQTGEEELYDLSSDPFELDNLALDPGYASITASRYARAKQLCSPPPPGMVV